MSGSIFYSASYYIIYLRKSRSDDPSLTVEEVLSKHETMLQEYAEREFGGRVPECNIYREVVSGESIKDRVEIQKVLERIEDPNCKGVLVVEPQRLSRGDLIDCGKLINWFQDSSTLVVTPIMTYDLNNKMERKFFQDELMRGRDYLEYVSEIMKRGKIAAVKRGDILTEAPLGYKRVKEGKKATLVIDEDWAPIIRLIFDMYGRQHLSARGIATKLTEMGIPTKNGNAWQSTTITRILTNERYVGVLTYGRVITAYVIENGERRKKSLTLKPDDPRVIRVTGNFEPLIDMETWDLVREAFRGAPRTSESNKRLRNKLAGLLRCAACGHAMTLNPLKKGNDPRYSDRYKRPGIDKPCIKSVREDLVNAALLDALENAELPALQAKAQFGTDYNIRAHSDLIASLERQLAEHRQQLSNMYDLREKDPSSYPAELFAERSALVTGRIKNTQEQLEKARASAPPVVDYQERSVALAEAIKALKDPDADVAATNRLLKTVIDRIELTGTPQGTPRGDNSFSLEVFLRL